MTADHDITPACWGILGRRGDSGAMIRAKRLMDERPAPWNTRTSDNIRCIQAVLNAVVWRDYENASLWFKRARDVGIGEGGGLYWPAGDVGYAIALTLMAKEDGKEGIYRQGREYLSWCADVMSMLATSRPEAGYVGIGPRGNQPSRRNPWLGDQGYVCMPGSRAAFSGHLQPNWYAEGPATNVYQWLMDIPGRDLSGRYQAYAPGESTWSSWPWLVAQIRGWLPAKRDPQPKTLRKVFRRNNLFGLIANVEPGPYRLRFGLDVVRADSWQLVAASHPTAGPKPPATWIEFTKTLYRIAFPDGYRNYGNDGRGKIQWDSKHVWASGVSTSNGSQLLSARHEREQVKEHWVLAPKATQWKKGALHPREADPVPPEPDPDPKPEPDDDRDWYEKITDSIRDFFRWIRRKM